MRIYPGQAEWKAVEQHLDRLLEMDETQWDDYLSALESDEPTVVAALREMMADRRNLEPQGFLETSLISPPDQERVGTQVGAYTIVSPIGRGGMGEVWLAQRSDGRFEGKFALKFLETYSSSPAALDRFQREGRLLARLAHPHIARLIDAGVTASGSPYLILEYVKGIRIDEYCATHRMTVEARVRLILDVLRALGARLRSLQRFQSRQGSHSAWTCRTRPLFSQRRRCQSQRADQFLQLALSNELDAGAEATASRLPELTLTRRLLCHAATYL